MSRQTLALVDQNVLLILVLLLGVFVGIAVELRTYFVSDSMHARHKLICEVSIAGAFVLLFMTVVARFAG
jgi:hypothetical protein